MLKLDWNLLFTIINILLLLILVKVFLVKPIKNIIAQRQAEADEEKKKNAEEKAELDELKKDYNEKLKEIETLKYEKLQEVRLASEKEYNDIIDDANKKAKRITEDAETMAKVERERMLDKAQKEITGMIIDAASKVVASSSESDQNQDSRLYDRFIEKAGDEK